MSPLIAQQPTRLDLIGVGGDPFSLLITFTITDENDDPVPWSEVTDPSVTIVGSFQRNTPAAVPTITSPESGQLLLSWSAGQTRSISTANKWALSVTINGSGPLAVIAGLISMFPDTSAGASGSTSADLAVSLGTANVALAVSLSGGGGVVQSVAPGNDTLTLGGTDAAPTLVVTPDTFDAYGAAAAAQEAAEAASDPAGSAATALASARTYAAGVASTAQSNAEAASDPEGSAAAVLATSAQKANNGSDFANAGSTRANIHVPALAACQAVSTTNVNIASPGSTIGGVAFPTAGGGSGVDQVLLAGQTTASQNGPWVWNGASSALTRPTDYAHGATVKGRTVQINNGSGTGNDQQIWSLATNASITVDTTATAWALGFTGTYVPINPIGDVAGGFFPITGMFPGVPPAPPSNMQFAVASATTTTATVAGTPWTVNEWTGWPVSVISGTGSAQVVAYITSNTNNTITIGYGHGTLPWAGNAWAVTPDNTSTIQIGFDQNYNAVQTAFTKVALEFSNLGTGGLFMHPEGRYWFPYGFPPVPQNAEVWAHSTGSQLFILSSYSQPYPCFSGYPGGRLVNFSITGPGGMVTGYAGTNRVRGVQMGNHFGLEGCTVNGFFVNASWVGNHSLIHDSNLQSGFYGLCFENFAAVPSGGNNDLENVLASGCYFAGVASSSYYHANFAWRGAGSHTGIGSPYCLIAVDYIDEETGYPGNMNFSTLSATSSTITVGPSGTPIQFLNNLAGRVVYIVSGTAAGESAVIASSTGATITITGTWGTTPDSTSVFTLAFPVVSATSTTATFAAASFDSAFYPGGQFTGLFAKIIAGTGVGNGVKVSINTANVVTVSSWVVQPDSTSIIQFQRQATAYGACEIYDDLAAEDPYNAVFQEFSANAGSANPSIQQCQITMGCAMGATPVIGLPSGYAWDINSAINSVLAVPGGFTGEGGSYVPTAFIRSRNPSSGFQLQYPLNESAPPIFDGSSHSDGIVLASTDGTIAGISKILNGAVAAGEPVESAQSFTNTVVRYAGGNFYGFASYAQTGGVIPVIQQVSGQQLGAGAGYALVASLTNTGYRLVPTAGTPGYFTASAATAAGSLPMFATATQSSGTPTLTPVELLAVAPLASGAIPVGTYQKITVSATGASLSAGTYRFRVVSGGSSGAAGGAAALTGGVSNQVGGAGGMGGYINEGEITIASSSAPVFVVGNGGASANGGAASAGSTGNAGANGNFGQVSSVTLGGITISSPVPGGVSSPGAANSSTGVNAYNPWSNAAINNNPTVPGCGGGALNNFGIAGGQPISSISGGGGGGVPATATLGGLGGTAGTQYAGGAALDTPGGWPTTTGVAGASAAANTGGGGGGGGGGAPGGAGGASGAGGSGYIELWRIA